MAVKVCRILISGRRGMAFLRDTSVNLDPQWHIRVNAESDNPAGGTVARAVQTPEEERPLWPTFSNRRPPTPGASMRLHSFAAAAAALSSLVSGNPALADVGPPDTHPECSVERVETPTSECVLCMGPGDMASPDARCNPLLSPYCFTKVCKSEGGGSAETDLWCRAKGAGVPVVPSALLSTLTDYQSIYASVDPNPAVTGTCLPYTAPTVSAGCSATGRGNGTPFGFFAVGIMAMTLLSRRRSAKKY